MMPRQSDRRAAQIVKELFGTSLQQQGRGLYVGLELLAICKGVQDLQDAGAEPVSGYELLLPPDMIATYQRRSHDLARRLATGTEVPAESLQNAVDGQATVATLRALLSSLVVTIPGRRRTDPAWFATHLYPFVGELVHYDAVQRRGGAPSIERYAFRDAGGFAYRVLRTDEDPERRYRIGIGIGELVRDSGSALGRVASALRSNDHAKPSTFDDSDEIREVVNSDKSPWPGLLRSGIDNIVARTAVPRAKRIEQVLHWTPYCIARHQLRLARRYLGESSDPIPLDCMRDSSPIRRRSQEYLNRYRWDIVTALSATARDLRDQRPDSEHTQWERYVGTNPSFAGSPRAFFSETLAAVGALNATSGRRHFTMKPEILEAMVAATTEPEAEVVYSEYLARLHDDLGVVIGPDEANHSGFTQEIDGEWFSRNRVEFRNKLAASGLLTRYSDATDLVHGEIR